VSPERDDDRDEDEREEFASRSIFSAGWFRAVLVLTVLAIVVVISLPYLLHWFEPSPPARVAKPAESLRAAPAPSATPAPAVAPAPALAPAAPVAAPPEVKAPPPAAFVTAPKAVVEKALPPVSSEPTRKATPEKAAATPEAEKAVTKAPARTGTERPPRKASETALAKSAEKPAAPTRVVAKADAPSRPGASARPSADAASGNYWIQLGAFKEQKNADALAQTLRDAGFTVQVTPIQRGGVGDTQGEAQQHELFVSEAGVEKVNAALKGRGRAQLAAGGVAVRPAFSLQEAMTVSKLLTDEGLKVVIRPASGLAKASQGQGTLHAVRAGGYSNRTSALAARDELAAKGHQGFVAEGPAK
jgi:cell division septation protein DedD